MTSPDSLTTLPALSDEERAHSRRLERYIREFLAARGGVVGFDTFMRLALYEPGMGYYSAGATKLGPSGDFVTAPEVSSLFSRCVARQVAEVLRVTGGDVLELGAGSGRMAADVLAELAALDVLPARYRILEVSADLAQRQRDRLAELPATLSARVDWLDRWPAEEMRGVVLANEVLDAMPVERFVLRGEPGAQRVRALGVAVEGDGFTWHESAAPAELENAVRTFLASLPAPLPDGYTSEVCLAFQPWMAGLAAHLDRGVALLIDYGLPRAQLYHPDRSQGTLRCHFRHRAHDDPFVNVGLQDITAWVDFTRVAEAADSAGLEVLGFTTQAGFLIGCGLLELAGALPRDDAVEWARQASALQQLISEAEMGELVKAIAYGRGLPDDAIGFARRDRRDSLRRQA